MAAGTSLRAACARRARRRTPPPPHARAAAATWHWRARARCGSVDAAGDDGGALLAARLPTRQQPCWTATRYTHAASDAV
jgi:hypothetical protein